MDHIEFPDRQTWDARRLWFEGVEEETRGQGSYFLSEQACALTAEVQCVFCAGAWVSVIVLAMAVVEAYVREVELPDFRGNAKRLYDEAGLGTAVQRLRKRRNAIIHVSPDDPAITVDLQWGARAELEVEARVAVDVMFGVMYMSPGT